MVHDGNVTIHFIFRELMKNLILGYFHTPASSRGEALRLIGRMLDFTKAEMEQVGVEAGRGWLGGLFRKVNPTPPSTPQANPNKVSNHTEASFYVSYNC